MSQVHELILKLKDLLVLIEEYDTAKAEKDSAEQALQSSSLMPTNLSNFDAAHLEAFIEEKIGPRPEEPGGFIRILVPIYLIQKGRFNAAYAAYEKLRPLAEAAYRETFQSERERLQALDETEKAKKIQAAEEYFSVAKSNLKAAQTRLNEDSTLSSSLKQRDIVTQLISFLEEGRADDLKEAVNLYYDEKRKDEEAEKAEAYRQEMKALEEEKVRAAQAAEEYQRMQYEEAQQAVFYAKQAADAAQDAAYAAQDAAEAAENAQFNQLYSTDDL